MKYNSKVINMPAPSPQLYYITFVPIAIKNKIAHLLVHRGTTFLCL